jgi:Mrp family chromosome partitioning ATPase
VLVADALVRSRHQSLAFLPAGSIPPNPAELLGSRSMTYLLDHLSRLADIVILDGPPLLAVTDSAVLAAKVDGVVLVASIDQTHRGALRRARSILARGTARALGVVVNRAHTPKGAHAYDSYYRSSNTSADVRPRRLEWRALLHRQHVRGEPVSDPGADLDLGPLQPDLHATRRSRSIAEHEPVPGAAVSTEDR